jgi:magnesium-transporting ATPase (P-type)
MTIDRSAISNVVRSWVFLLVILISVVFEVYDHRWATMMGVQQPNHARWLLIMVILALAWSANLLGRILLREGRFSSVRALLSGTVVTVVLCCMGIFYPDMSGFRPLMSEGWGMMFPFLAIFFGLLAALREGFEKRSNKREEAA